jgi:hypothetical protein
MINIYLRVYEAEARMRNRESGLSLAVPSAGKDQVFLQQESPIVSLKKSMYPWNKHYKQ